MRSRSRTFSGIFFFSRSTGFKIYPCFAVCKTNVVLLTAKRYSRLYFHHGLLITPTPPHTHTTPMAASPILHYYTCHKKHLRKCSLCISGRISLRYICRGEILSAISDIITTNLPRDDVRQASLFSMADGETEASRDYIICLRLPSKASIQMSIFSEVHTLLSP